MNNLHKPLAFQKLDRLVKEVEKKQDTAVKQSQKLIQ